MPQPVKGKLNEFIVTKDEQEKGKSKVTWLGVDAQLTPAGVFGAGETKENMSDEAVSLIRGIGDPRFLINGEPVSPHVAAPETKEEKEFRDRRLRGDLEGAKTAAEIQKQIEKEHGKLAVDPVTGIPVKKDDVVRENDPVRADLLNTPNLTGDVPRGTGEASVSNPVEDIEAERLSEARAVETKAKENKKR